MDKLSEAINKLNVLSIGTPEERLLDHNRLLLTEAFNEVYQDFRKSINEDIKEFGNPHEDQLNPYRNMNDTEMYAFSSIPRTEGIAGIFAKPASIIGFSQLHQATLDAIIGTQLQHLRSYLFNNFRDYSHKNKDFEKLVKKTMFSCDWDTYFLFGASDFLKTGSAVGEKIWAYDKVTKQYYIERIVFAPTTNVQYMVDLSGKVIGAVQPNVFANTQGLFDSKVLGQRQSEFATREYIGQQLPYMIVERRDLFYCAYDAIYDPYGISPVRRAYQYFQNKQLLLAMLMTASARNSSPYILAYFDKNNLTRESQLEDVRDSLASMSVGDSALIPQGIEIASLDVNKGSIDSIIKGIEYLDQMQNLAMFGLGSGDSFASDESIRYQVIQSLDLYVATMRSAIERDILLPLAIHNNYPEVYNDLDFGKFVSKEINEDSKQNYSNIVSDAISNGLIDVKSKDVVNEILGKLNLPIGNGSTTIEDNLAIILPAGNGEDTRTGTYAKNGNKAHSNNNNIREKK